MNGLNLQGLAPLLAVSGGAVLLMLQISVRRRETWSYAITLGTLLLAAVQVLPAARVAPQAITPLLQLDHYALFFSLVFCLSGAVTAVISREYLINRPGENEEYYLLLLLATLGAITLAYADHMVSLLLGLELMGVSLYVLIAYPDQGSLPLEASIKYLVLSGAASSIMLFGIALVYAATGTMDYAELGARLGSGQASDNPALILAGLAMIISGLGFKLSVVPFHMWTPDVYEGAPAPVSGYLAAVSKGAVFVALMRWYLESGAWQSETLTTTIAVLAAASILVGNWMALLQENVKRTLAYSSIAHVGYLLIVLVAGGVNPQQAMLVEAASFYLVAYIVTTLAAFTLLGLISRDSGELERDQLRDLRGLFWQRPTLAILFTVALLSLAGIPMTAGFIGKFYIVASGVNAQLWVLLGVLVIGSAISVYYYLRIVFTMASRSDEAHDGIAPQLMIGSQVALYLLIFFMLYLGLLPAPLMMYLGTIL